jgi:Domain of unknown function (DUF1906)
MKRSLMQVVAGLSLSITLATTMQGQSFAGFDRNNYPGDAALAALRKNFSFAGYWVTNPPGERSNSWVGKRAELLKQGFGFLVLANGRMDAQIIRARKAGTKPQKLGEKDAAVAVTATKREGFPAGTIVFLDQEEGGRLLPEQMEYLLGWTEAVAKSGFRPGVYASGQPVEDGPGKTITTVENIRQEAAAKGLHPVAMFVYQDACPPSNGCSVVPPALGRSGTPDAVVWQYAQSPRRPENTAACGKTYAKDGSCYALGVPGIHLDLSVAGTDDPSHGR